MTFFRIDHGLRMATRHVKIALVGPSGQSGSNVTVDATHRYEPQ